LSAVPGDGDQQGLVPPGLEGTRVGEFAPGVTDGVQELEIVEPARQVGRVARASLARPVGGQPRDDERGLLDGRGLTGDAGERDGEEEVGVHGFFFFST
jgi:hypothetical protein